MEAKGLAKSWAECVTCISTWFCSVVTILNWLVQLPSQWDVWWKKFCRLNPTCCVWWEPVCLGISGLGLTKSSVNNIRLFVEHTHYSSYFHLFPVMLYHMIFVTTSETVFMVTFLIFWVLANSWVQKKIPLQETQTGRLKSLAEVSDVPMTFLKKNKWQNQNPNPSKQGQIMVPLQVLTETVFRIILREYTEGL